MPQPRAYSAIKPLRWQAPRRHVLLRMPPDQRRNDSGRRDRVYPEGRSEAPNRDHQTREGGAYRAADIQPDAVERNGRLKACAQHELGHDRLPRRHDDSRRRSGQNDEGQQNGGSDTAGVNQKSKGCDENGGGSLHSNEKTSPVNDISKSSRRKCKQQHRHGCRHLNQRHQEWIGRQSGHDPAGSSVLHPHADIGHDGRNPQHRERPVAEWRPGGTRRVAPVKQSGAGVHGTHETHSGGVVEPTRLATIGFCRPVPWPHVYADEKAYSGAGA